LACSRGGWFDLHRSFRWIDAICINQSDNKEKGIQVNMMGDIYDRATEVLVWLGEAPTLEVEKAFRLLRAINDYIDSQIVESELAADSVRAIVYIPVLVHWDQLFHDPSESEALQRFWLEPWFCRVWVVQEVALASSAWVFYGESSISLSEVIQTAVIMGIRQDLQNQFDVARWSNAFTNSLSMYTLKDNWIQESRLLRGLQEVLKRRGMPNFNYILNNSSEFEATIPLDYIYAFLGHPAAKRPDGSSMLEADYTISVEDACQKLAQSQYEQDERLDFLCTLSHSTLADIDETPSWVPMIHKKKVRNWFSYNYWYADNFVKSYFPKAVFQGGMLHGKAFIFDSITICPGNFGQDAFETTNPSVVEMYWSMQAAHIQPSEREERLHTFMWTLVGGGYMRGSERLQRDFYAYCREKTSPEFCPSIGVKNIETEHHSLVEGHWREFEVTGYFRMGGRRFFVGESGRVGLGSSLLQAGDLCCVLIGCRMPLVIRPTSTSNHFKVLGEAYIHDVMYGEIIKAHMGSTSESRDITLV
jgi:hypothetical protein